MQTFMLGEVTVYPELNRLHVGGRDVHLEPKVMALLEALALRPQQVVGRQQLLDRVWAGTVVGEEALTRCVSQLRAALGDRASKPTYIQTVPKRGYRLLVAPSPVAQRAAPGPIGERMRRPTTRRWLAAAAAVLISALGALWTAQGIDRPRSIAVLAFDADTLLPGAGLREYFGAGFVEDLQNALVEIPQLRVSAQVGLASAHHGASAPRDGTSARQGGDAQQIGRDLGVDVVLTGSVRRVGDRLRVSVRLVDVIDGHHLWARTFEWDELDVDVLFEAIVGSVAEALGVGPVQASRVVPLYSASV